MSLLSTTGFRDPLLEVFEDPWLSTWSSDVNRPSRRRQQLANANRVLACDSFETDQEFKVICEVSWNRYLSRRILTDSNCI